MSEHADVNAHSGAKDWSDANGLNRKVLEYQLHDGHMKTGV